MAERRHFEEGGAGYARHRPTYPPVLAGALAALTAGRGQALDVGCGNGQLTVLLAAEFDRVTGTDISADQIANAEPRPNIDYRVEPAEASALTDGSVDLIVAAQAAHWFDLPRFYAEVRRLAAPGAALALVSYGVPELAGPAAERFRRFYWGDIHPFWPEGRAHVEQGYASLDFPFAELSIPALVIERDWSFSALAGYVSTWSAVKAAAKAGQGEIAETTMTEIAALWGDPGTEYRISWPITGRFARLD
ncbi:class I SAM-dependent methyltransferase [uncultured Paracoccus sp.]|uniref:class I SAM-dependent methyltransferase n=1 Tax=uncultured Paracoccus sp. TaxID=189685 RepID=UPI002611F085|nr:class I SAM-dependent methyltransferase [uncultured Paracoccus sp.]